MSTFSSLNWNKLSLSDKAAHSLPNCYACANNFLMLQKSFPLAPIYEPNSLSESASEKSFIKNEYPKFDSLCKQTVGQLFSVLANRHPDKLGLRNTKSEVQKAIRDTQRKCTAECNASLEKSTLQAAYSTDLSFSRLQRYCKAQYYEPPNESSRKKKRYSLQSHQCNRYDELVDKLTNWDDSTPFIATSLAKDFEVVGTDAAHKIKTSCFRIESNNSWFGNKT